LGAWGGELPTALIVEQVSSNGTAQVIYAWGDSPQLGFKSGWERRTGFISNGKLLLAFKKGPTIDFVLQPGGGLLGRYEMKDAPPSFAALHRLSATNAVQIRGAAEKMAVPWEEIQIPVQSQVGPAKSKTFTLQTTIFRQPSPGKHPVIIVNHGSTGPGIIPANFVFRGGNDVEFFRSLGFVVVEPMRKGRGQSGGPDLEEDDSLPPNAELDSAVEDLHAVLGYLSGQSDIDSRRVVLSGASRGGLLAVAYAGRYPTNVLGVLNFSGGWFGEAHPQAEFNFETFGKAGHDAKVPMLWLYAENDSYYSLKFVEREFSKFQAAGGRGELVEVHGMPGDGHQLCLWADRWRDKVAGFLNAL